MGWRETFGQTLRRFTADRWPHSHHPPPHRSLRGVWGPRAGPVAPNTMTFWLNARSFTYAFRVNDLQELEHLHWGAKIDPNEVRISIPHVVPSFECFVPLTLADFFPWPNNRIISLLNRSIRRIFKKFLPEFHTKLPWGKSPIPYSHISFAAI